MRQKKAFLGRLGQHLDIPREALPGGFGLALSGQQQLTVRGCKKILAYGPECICLSLGTVSLSVLGSDLLCTVFEAGNVTVEGEIACLRFEGGGAL